LRTRAATASRRGSTALALFARPLVERALVRAPVDFFVAVARAARGLVALDFALAVLRVVRFAPADLLALARLV
jgi:hypothetical protein